MSVSPERIKHLEFIQATITRQASHSFAIKSWSLTVSGAIYAYTASHLSWWLAVVALLPPLAFAWLDMFYLRQERLFRELYRDAIKPESQVTVFSMDTNCYQDRVKYPRCAYCAILKANTWWVLHLMIVSVGLVLLGVAIFQ